ncbi:MAG TPA: hypothetical protein VFF73_21475 [Planctomycetota bacterium]|nr:hypothetical protein [Planctomycetota bacterium]
MSPCKNLLRVGVCLLVLTRPALAGMPTFDLTDAASARLDTISFFLVAFLLTALGIRLLWNHLRKDFTRLPKLSYPRALSLTLVWALLFLFVLTMISGARELMTPGAWKKDGSTYRLADPPIDAQARVARLEALRDALWKFARAHEGRLPDTDSAEGVAESTWRVLDDSRAARFVYFGGRSAGRGAVVVAHEPGAFGAWRYTLLSSGEIELRSADELVVSR